MNAQLCMMNAPAKGTQAATVTELENVLALLDAAPPTPHKCLRWYPLGDQFNLPEIPDREWPCGAAGWELGKFGGKEPLWFIAAPANCNREPCVGLPIPSSSEADKDGA